MAIPGDLVGEALDRFLSMPPSALKSYKPKTIAESLAIRMILKAITGDGDITAAKIILERTSGRPRQADAQATESTPLQDRLKEMGVWQE